MKFIFATHNKGKVGEMKEILKDLSAEILSAEEVGIFDDVLEDGETLEENAFKKANFVAEKIGEWSIADDTGLFIDALEGAPGLHTARWAGPDISGDKLARFTIEKMKDVPYDERGAKFASVICLVSPNGEKFVFQGEVKGRISQDLKGELRPSLPYDLIFIPEGYDKTFSEIEDEEKNSISHRGRALEKFKEFVKQKFYEE